MVSICTYVNTFRWTTRSWSRMMRFGCWHCDEQWKKNDWVRISCLWNEAKLEPAPPQVVSHVHSLPHGFTFQPGRWHPSFIYSQCSTGRTRTPKTQKTLRGTTVSPSSLFISFIQFQSFSRLYLMWFTSVFPVWFYHLWHVMDVNVYSCLLVAVKVEFDRLDPLKFWLLRGISDFAPMLAAKIIPESQDCVIQGTGTGGENSPPRWNMVDIELKWAWSQNFSYYFNVFGIWY